MCLKNMFTFRIQFCSKHSYTKCFVLMMLQTLPFYDNELCREWNGGSVIWMCAYCFSSGLINTMEIRLRMFCFKRLSTVLQDTLVSNQWLPELQKECRNERIETEWYAICMWQHSNHFQWVNLRVVQILLLLLSFSKCYVKIWLILFFGKFHYLS